MSVTVPGRASVPPQADGDVGRTIDLDAPRVVEGVPGRTRADSARDAIHVGACALAGVFVTAGFALTRSFDETDGGSELLAAITQNPDRFYAGNLVAAFGLAMIAATGLAVLRLVHGRGRVLATIGGVMVMIGAAAAGAGIFMYGAVTSVMADSGQDLAQMVVLEDALSNSARAGVTFLFGFPGMFLGLLVCVIALFVSHATPRWVPATLLAGIVAVLSLGDTSLSAVANVLLTVGLLGIALSLWKATRPAQPA